MRRARRTYVPLRFAARGRALTDDSVTGRRRDHDWRKYAKIIVGVAFVMIALLSALVPRVAQFTTTLYR